MVTGRGGHENSERHSYGNKRLLRDYLFVGGWLRAGRGGRLRFPTTNGGRNASEVVLRAERRRRAKVWVREDPQ
nr:hypothetical protein Iba_chr08cCG11750 [Ipomoea batatas]